MTDPIPDFDAWWRAQGQHRPTVGRKAAMSIGWNAALAWARARARANPPEGPLWLPDEDREPDA